MSFAILDVLYGKAFQVVGIQTANHKIFLTNTHLLSAYALAGKGHQNTRVAQVTEIVTYLKTVTNNNIIIVGDFNFEPNTEPYQTIVGEKYIDISQQILKTTNKKLDFIFTKNLSANVINISSTFTNLSDHAFLTLELQTL